MALAPRGPQGDCHGVCPRCRQEAGANASTSATSELSTSTNGTAGEPVVELAMKSIAVISVASWARTNGQRRRPLRNHQIVSTQPASRPRAMMPAVPSPDWEPVISGGCTG